MELPPGHTDMKLFRRALARNVAVVPGSAFFVSQGHGHDRFVRLNYSNQTIERIRDGIRRLGVALSPGTELAEAPVPITA